MNTFGYIRVSSIGQVDGDGPERQRESVLRFCKANALGFPEFYEEPISGTVDGMDRPRFAAMIEAIGRLRALVPGAEVCIVVERMDRLARTLIVQELLLRECSDDKIPVYLADQDGLVDQANPEADPTRKMLRQIMGAVAEWDKSVTVLKLRKARERIRHKTGRCEGQLPYGSTELERMAQRQFKQQLGSGMSYGEIAASANIRNWKTRKGNLWTRGAVYQAVNRRGVKSNLTFSPE